MAAPDPPWRIKSRPCPFYHQNRCLFADSCNFLHEVKVAGPSQAVMEDVISSRPPADLAGDHTTPSQRAEDNGSVPRQAGVEPAEAHERQRSISSCKSSPKSIRSPRRSPRMSGLLFALREVIGSDEEAEEDDPETNQNDDQVGGELVPQNPNDSSEFPHPQQSEDHHERTTDDPSASKTVGSSSSPPYSPFTDASADMSMLSALSDFPSHPFTLSPEHQPLASTPTRSPSSKLREFTFPNSADKTHREESFDSGYADGWISPIKPSLSPPRSAGLSSTFDLLVSPLAPPITRLSPIFPALGLPPSPSFGGFPHVSQGNKASPPHTPRRDTSLHEDLDSPGEHQVGTYEETWEHTFDESQIESESPTQIPDRDGDFWSSPIDADSPLGLATARPLIKDFGNTPTKSSFDSPYLVDSEDHTITMDNTFGSAGSDASSSPASLTSDNGPIHTIFDSYSDPSNASSSTDVNLAETTGTTVDSESHAALPSGSVTKEIWGAIFEDEPSPAVSRRDSGVSDLSQGRKTDNQQDALTGRRSDTASKVPFGFRQSFALGNASASSLMRNRSSRERVIRRSLPRVVTDFSPKGQSDDANPIPTPSLQNDDKPLPGPSWMKPLRLSRVLHSFPSSAISSPSQLLSSNRISFVNNEHISSTTPRTASVSSSDHSSLDNRSLSSARSSVIPAHVQNSLIPINSITTPPPSSDNSPVLSLQAVVHSAPPAGVYSWAKAQQLRPGSSLGYEISSPGLLSSCSEPVHGSNHDNDSDIDESANAARRRSRPAINTRPLSALRSPVHAIATPIPTLLFAIASDDVSEVIRVLESGEAGPNDEVGPQSALAFTLTNPQLKHKMEIVKVLLAYGADASCMDDLDSDPKLRHCQSINDDDDGHLDEERQGDEAACDDEPLLDPAMRYYLTRARSPVNRQAVTLINASTFRPLTRIRYDLIGQDRALEQLYRVLAMHSKQSLIHPLVVLCCGPSGHGKSLLARKFGHLLDVPTHTVNMTTLQSTHDLWQSHSMSPYEEPSTLTLADFLTENEGKRCVVVLDEIEKSENERNLYSLLAPWELGRCSVHPGRPHIDVRNVIWIGTSNIGHDFVFEFHTSRTNPDAPMSRREYAELTALLRPKVSECLGPSLLSRVTSVLPFVPFSHEEMLAIASEAFTSTLSSSGGPIAAHNQPDITLEVQKDIIERAVRENMPAEGVRSLHRAVSMSVMDAL